MFILKFPKKLCEVICSRVAKFWWAKGDKDHGIYWKNGFTCGKCKGGLGFKDFTLMNLALLAKQAWRIINNPNSLWVRFSKAVYFPTSTHWRLKRRKEYHGFGLVFFKAGIFSRIMVDG